MKRLIVIAALTSGAGLLAAAPQANAQTVCCVDPGLRGYAAPPQAYAPPQGYGPPQGYAPPSGPFGDGLRGYIGVEYSKARLNPGTPSPRTETWTGEAAVTVPMRGLNLQADVKVARYDGETDDGWVTSPTLHLYQRNPWGALGAFAGVSNTGDATLYGAGLEGQANMTGATLYGSLGFGRVNDGVDSNIVAARLEGRYFLTENFRLNASFGYVRQTAGNLKSEARVAGIGAEYQFGTFPAALNVGYQHADAAGSSAESDTIRIGMRWALSGQTLAQRDREGPSFGNITDLFLAN